MMFHSTSLKAEGVEAVASNMEVVEGLVLVEAKVNGQSGRFILDTGSPDLILNSRYFNGKKSKAAVNGILGQLEGLSEVQVKRFDWMNIRKRFINALALDLNSLEQKTALPILGLIGYELLRDHELLIDYQKQRIELIPVESKPAFSSRLLAQLPFQMQGHLPVIEVNIGEYSLRLGLDSGAQANLLDAELLGILPEEILLGEKRLTIKSIEQKSVEVPLRQLARFSLGNAKIPGQKFAFLPLSMLSPQKKLAIDGLLGFPFLSKAKVSINYATGMLCFYE